MADNPYAKYADNALFTAPKEELALMLYDGALKFANQAVTALEAKDYAKVNEMIIRVENIIIEFQMTLDKKYEVSNNLNLLYDYMYRRLLDANIQKEMEPLVEVRDMIRELRDTWKEAMKLAKQNPLPMQ